MVTKEKNEEILDLSEEILKNFELCEIPTHQIILKCLRLARLLNDMEAFYWLRCEANGYDTKSDGFLTNQAWAATEKSGRRYFQKEKNKKPAEYAFTNTIATMEATIEISKKRLEVAYDPNISVSSHSEFNPHLPQGNAYERNTIAQTISDYTKKIECVKSKLYEYVLNVNYELKFGNINEDIFNQRRSFIDRALKNICPEAIQKFISVYNNMKSGNDEDWANAVHSCRRILKELSDVLYPPSNEPVIKENGSKIKIGDDHYINRLILYIESKSSSDKFNHIVGSHLNYIGERLDSVYEAANKGSHHEVTSEEAERYIIYTYLLIGDILSL